MFHIFNLGTLTLGIVSFGVSMVTFTSGPRKLILICSKYNQFKNKEPALFNKKQSSKVKIRGNNIMK